MAMSATVMAKEEEETNQLDIHIFRMESGQNFIYDA